MTANLKLYSPKRLTVKKGDLAWVPSGVTLLRFKNNEKDLVIGWLAMHEPSNVLVLDNDSDSTYCKVVYKGENWNVLKKDIYERGK